MTVKNNVTYKRALELQLAKQKHLKSIVFTSLFKMHNFFIKYIKGTW